MRCVYCGKTPKELDAHYAVCTDAPEFVVLQAKSELRHAKGPRTVSCLDTEGRVMPCHRNHIDRGEAPHDLRVEA